MKAMSRYTGAILLAAVSTSAFAQAKADFGAFAMCAKLSKMPAGYQAVECNRRDPLRECRFTLPADKLPITYLIEAGTVTSKWLKFGPRATFTGPFGLKQGDSETAAMAKAKRSTGLAFEKWADDEVEGGTYHQSTDIKCRNNTYNVRIFFQNGVLETVSVSSLPMV